MIAVVRYEILGILLFYSSFVLKLIIKVYQNIFSLIPIDKAIDTIEQQFIAILLLPPLPLLASPPLLTAIDAIANIAASAAIASIVTMAVWRLHCYLHPC